MSDCNDGTDESSPPELQGYLILSETESQCGSKCKLGPTLRSSSSESRRYWTQYTSQAKDIKAFDLKSTIAMHIKCIINQNLPSFSDTRLLP